MLRCLSDTELGGQDSEVVEVVQREILMSVDTLSMRETKMKFDIHILFDCVPHWDSIVRHWEQMTGDPLSCKDPERTNNTCTYPCA